MTDWVKQMNRSPRGFAGWRRAKLVGRIEEQVTSLELLSGELARQRDLIDALAREILKPGRRR